MLLTEDMTKYFIKLLNCGASIFPPMISTNSPVNFMSGSKAKLPPGELSNMNPKSMWIMALLGIPISLLFWWATKIGYEGFGSLWKIRLLGFGISMLTFPVMTYFYLGEAMTIKTILTLGLAIIIMLIQLI